MFKSVGKLFLIGAAAMAFVAFASTSQAAPLGVVGVHKEAGVGVPVETVGFKRGYYGKGFHGKSYYGRGFHRKGFHSKGFHRKGFHSKGFKRGFHGKGFHSRSFIVKKGFYHRRGFYGRGVHGNRFKRY